MELVVMKFGGTSVQDVPALQRLVGIVAGETRAKLVVVSALAGVTDALHELGARGTSVATRERAASRLFERHADIASALVAPPLRQFLIDRLQLRFRAAAAIAETSPAGVGPRERDALLAIGELASSDLVAAMLASAGLPAVWVDARHVVVTDNDFGRARPDSMSIKNAVDQELQPLVRGGRIPVAGGFVGATITGTTTTLGRGGSDYSAALLAAALDAGEIQIWTDVDGVLSADPTVVSSPVLLPSLTFQEAFELARFGAKVLHSGTLEPASSHGIQIRVLNSQRPESAGTTISSLPPSRAPGVVGLAFRPNVHVAHLWSDDVGGSLDFVRAAATWLDRLGRDLIAVQMSPARLVAVSPEESPLRDIISALEPVARGRIYQGCDLVTLVGAGVSADARAWDVVGREGIRGRVLQAVAAQSGDALSCVAPGGLGTRIFADLHEILVCGVGRHAPAGPALVPHRTSADTPVGTQSTVGA